MDNRITQLVKDSDFELKLYEAAVRNLRDTENRLRFNNFAYAMRELSRHFLKRLAPDDQVVKCSWYKNVTGEVGKLARSERASFAVHGGLAEKFVREKLHIDLKSMNKRLKDTIDALSKYTHIEEDVFNLSPADIDRLAAETTETFAEFFETIKRCRDEIASELNEAIGTAAFQEIVMNAVPGMDELSTHQFVDDIYIEDAEVTAIDCKTVYLEVSGTLYVELQYGSGSDIRKGEGTTIDDSFPFACKMTCPTSDPSEKSLELQGRLEANFDSFYGLNEEQDASDQEREDYRPDEAARGLRSSPAGEDALA
ncbi:TPA: hypothetical protein U8214_000695 [Pseudomonas putida]|nr:hypothetical protein [Pseudomonas putida]HEN8726836.1 hypothetical protein [Pseudomonas putida]